MKKSSVSRMQRFMYFQILCYFLESWIRTQHQLLFGKKNELVQSFTKVQNFGTIDAEPMEFESIFPGFTTLQLVQEVQRPITIQGTNYLHVDVQWHHMGISRKWTGMRIKRQLRFHLCEKIFTRKKVIPRTWITKRSGILLKLTDHKEKWDRFAELMMIIYGESGHPVFRATSPLSRGTLKSKGGEKLSIHFCADGDTVETVFRTIISVNRLSIYGAVSHVWGIQCLSNKNGETRIGTTIWPIVCADKFVDENTYTFDRWSCARRSIAKVQRTSG